MNSFCCVTTVYVTMKQLSLHDIEAYAHIPHVLSNIIWFKKDLNCLIPTGV